MTNPIMITTTWIFLISVGRCKIYITRAILQSPVFITVLRRGTW